jgi:signal transduction histidine kinase
LAGWSARRLDDVNAHGALVQQWATVLVSTPKCRFDVACDGLSGDRQVTVYRGAQEALHNVLKQAHAAHVSVLSEAAATSASGMIEMNERAALARGTLHVESRLGHGTTVSCAFRCQALRRGVALCRERSDPPRRAQHRESASALR